MQFMLSDSVFSLVPAPSPFFGTKLQTLLTAVKPELKTPLHSILICRDALIQVETDRGSSNLENAWSLNCYSLLQTGSHLTKRCGRAQ